MRSSTSPLGSCERWRPLALWLGILAGPVVWLALLAIAFVVAVGACHSGGRWRLHALIVGGLAAVAASGYLAWTSARGRAFADESQAPPLSDDTRRQRTQWMRLAGLASTLWFLLVILAMEVPLLILGECQ